MSDEIVTMPRWEFDALLNEQYQQGYDNGYDDGLDEAERAFHDEQAEVEQYRDLPHEDYYVEGDVEPPMEADEHDGF
jgi:hypothetical protein